MIRWTSIVVFFALILTFSNSYAVETIRITNGEWAPFQSENLKHFGLASRIVTEAFRIEGFNVKYGFFPWKRSYWLVERGKWDGSAIWQSTADREKIFYVSDPVIEGEIVFFHLKGFKFDWKKIDDLKGYSIGGSIGYTYGRKFDDMAKRKRLKVEFVKTDKQNFTKLLKGRIDIFPCDREVGYYLLQIEFGKKQIDSIVHHPRPVKKTAYRLLLSRKREKNLCLIHSFNHGLKELKERGLVNLYIQESNSGKYIKK